MVPYIRVMSGKTPKDAGVVLAEAVANYLAGKDAGPPPPCYSVKSKLLPGANFDGPVHYLRYLWEDKQYVLEHLDQDFVDLVDTIILSAEARLS